MSQLAQAARRVVDVAPCPKALFESRHGYELGMDWFCKPCREEEPNEAMDRAGCWPVCAIEQLELALRDEDDATTERKN